MDTNLSRKHHTIFDWEQNLAPQVRQVELLGEINLSEEETQYLGQQLGAFIKSRQGWGVLEVREAIRKKCPCAFIVFLVSKGLYDSNAENGFWADIDQALGLKLDSNWHRQFGLLFEEILDLNNLPLFPDMGGYRYVSLILVHGGIPTYSLYDYFHYLLCPAVTRSSYAGLPSTELIDEWVHHASGRYFSDKAVVRFLQYGGQVAIDFVSRTRDLAHDFLESGLVSPTEQVGLPQRVIEAFHHWVVEKKGFDSCKPSGPTNSGLRLRRPEIQLDPWGEGLTLQLFPQQIPATLSQTRISWEIKLDGQLELTLPVRVERVGYNLQTTAEARVLERPLSTCEVTLRFDGEIQRTWPYNLERSLLVFDPVRETLLPLNTSLPARPLWLLYSHNATLEIIGAADKIEEFPPLPWGWAGFKGENWDLSQATQLTLRRDNQDLLQLPVRPDELEKRPHLVSGTLHETFNLIHTPLYLGSPPLVRIPLVGRTSLDEELARWRFTLYNPWAAAPSLDLRRIPLTDLRPHLIEQDGYVDLPLNSPALLGDTPLGSYIVRLRGPLGRDAELPLRLLPYLDLTGHERLYLPDPQSGPAAIELLVETPPGIIVEPQAEDHPCQVHLLEHQAEHWLHQVQVPSEVIEARLMVVKLQPGGEAIRVPLHVPLRRLRWALTGDTAQADSQSVKYTGSPIKQSMEALEQMADPVLFVDLGHTAATQPELREKLTLFLVDLDGQELQQQPFIKLQRDPGRSIWRFDLVAFLDTIRHTSAPVVRFELEYTTEEGPVRLPVLSLTRSIHVENVQVQIQDTDLTTRVKVTWHEPTRLRHRRVRFWPVWQPWRSYLEEVIPDHADGEFNFEVAGLDFLVGKYLLEFLVVDPWAGASQSPLQPPQAGPNTAVLELTPVEERLRQIEQGIQGTGPSFSLYLEHAYLEADRNQLEHALPDLWQCYKWFDQATIPQTLAMVDLVEKTDDHRLLTVLRLKMSKAERLQQLLDDYNARQVSEVQLETYRNELLRRTGLWPIDACAVLLNFPYEPMQFYALMHLIRRGASLAGEIILERIKNHRLSDLDGVDLFEINMDFGATFLTRRLDDAEAMRLFMGLTEREPDREWPVLLVRSGHFIHCAAGWGRIETIEVLEAGQKVDYFLKGETGFRLQAVLRPTHDRVPITIEVLADRQRVHFQPGLKLRSCSRSKDCNFVTPDENLLFYGHNKAAHDGIGAQFELKTSPLVSIKSLEYRLRAPQDMLT